MADSPDRDFLDSQVVGRLSRLLVHSRVPMVGNISGMHRSPHRGSSVEFAEYRKYVPGDDIRHIDWRVYGKSDRFYMKEFEADTNLRCHLIIDTSASMGYQAEHGSRLDYARRMAATLAWLLVHQGDAVGLQTFTDALQEEIPPRHNAAHLKHLFDTMGNLKASGETEVIATLHEIAEKIPQRALVIVFSDFFTDLNELFDCFEHLRFRKHDLAVFHLVDRSELDFEFDRPIRFVDMEDNSVLITDPIMLRDRYQQVLHDHLEKMKAGCTEHLVDYTRVITDENYEEVLAEFLLSRTVR